MYAKYQSTRPLQRTNDSNFITQYKQVEQKLSLERTFSKMKDAMRSQEKFHGFDPSAFTRDSHQIMVRRDFQPAPLENPIIAHSGPSQATLVIPH